MLGSCKPKMKPQAARQAHFARCTVLCCAVLCHAMLCCTMLSCIVICCAVLCCVVLCCAVLCCAVLCCAALCCAALCCAALFCTSNVTRTDVDVVTCGSGCRQRERSPWRCSYRSCRPGIASVPANCVSSRYRLLCCPGKLPSLKPILAV